MDAAYDDYGRWIDYGSTRSTTTMVDDDRDSRRRERQLAQVQPAPSKGGSTLTMPSRQISWPVILVLLPWSLSCCRSHGAMAASADPCFDGEWTESKCCDSPEGLKECFETDDDLLFSRACCESVELEGDPPPPTTFHPEAEARISCRELPGWRRFRRFLSLSWQDGTILSYAPDLLNLLGALTHYMIRGAPIKQVAAFSANPMLQYFSI
jgi:hypothetical protein